MANKLDRMVNCHEGILPISHNTLKSCTLAKSCDYHTMPMATSLGRMVTYQKGLPPITSHDLSITCPCEVT